VKVRAGAVARKIPRDRRGDFDAARLADHGGGAADRV
jgi:hypothetical protein